MYPKNLYACLHKAVCFNRDTYMKISTKETLGAQRLHIGCVACLIKMSYL